MALKLAIRGTGVDAHISHYGKTPEAVINQTAIAPAVVADATSGVFGGSLIDMTNATWTRGLAYSGKGAIGSQAFTIIYRFVPTWTGSPSGNQGLIQLFSGKTSFNFLEMIYHTSGGLYLNLINKDAVNALVPTISASLGGATSGTPMEICIATSGVSGASVYVSVNGAEVATFTLTATVLFNPLLFLSLLVGTTNSASKSLVKVNEILFYDTQEAHVYTARTAFDGTAAFDGQSTDTIPASSLIVGQNPTVKGLVVTGSAIVALAASTKIGVTANDGAGAYDGSDRHTDPGVANVRSGTAYKDNSLTNNRTGTAAIPAASHVRSGTGIDATTGTLAVPSAADVRNGTAVDATTGTLAVPTAGNVKLGVSVDATTGTLESTDPGVANVRLSTAYKIESASLVGELVAPSLADTKTGVAGDGGAGTYDGSDRWTSPSAGDLRSGIELKSNSVTTNLTGTLTVPSLANTKTGVAGDGGTGTYDGSDRWTSPSAGQLASGVQLKSNSTTVNLTGTLETVTNVISELRIKGGGQSGTDVAQNAVTITRGDAITFQLSAYSGDTAHDLTGATFETRMPGENGEIIIENSAHTANPDQITYTGKFTLTLTSAQSLLLKYGGEKDLVTKVTQNASVIHFHGRDVFQVLLNHVV